MTVIPLTPVPADLAERTEFKGEIVPLYDLYRQSAAKGETMVSGKTFTNCRIDGPAVMLALGGVDFDGCHFGATEGDARNLLLAPLSPDKVTGAVPVAHCRFIACNFFQVGFTGAAGFLEALQGAVSTAAPVPGTPH